jgi:hypothetical protein
MDQMLAPHEITRYLETYKGRWAIVGGKALEVFFGIPSWREHTDTDVMCPSLSGTAITANLGARGALLYPFVNSETVHEIPKTPAEITPQSYAVKHGDQDFWLFELVVDAQVTETTWGHKHNPEFTLPLTDVIVGKTFNGVEVPLLSPEISLAYKYLKGRPKDVIDLRVCLPLLDVMQQRRFAEIVRQAKPN